MATSKITMQVDAKGAITNLGQMQKQLDSTNKSIKGIMKSLQENNTSGAKGIANIDFRNYTAQLERQADAYKLVDESGDSYTKTVKLYKNALLEASRQNQFTIEQINVLKDKYQEAKDNLEMFNKETGKSVSKMDAFKSKMFEVGKNILVFQTAIALFRKSMTAVKNTIKTSIESAASAEQVFSKLSTVYDGYSDSALKASQKLADSLGVAQTTAASSLSTIGDLLQAQGMSVSESLTTAAEWAKQLQDIIAFKDLNMSLEEFAQNFMSGAAGNLRNFRTFGSIVKESAVEVELAKQGLDKLTGSELELAKMTIRANMALEQQANAMGATEREWDTALSINRRLSEATKEWKENLGESLNNVVKPIKEVWVNILETINESNRRQREFQEAQANGYEYYDTTGKNPTNDKKMAKQLVMKVQTALATIPQIDTSESATWARDFEAVSKEVEHFDVVVSALKEAMALTNASVDDINNKWKLSADVLDELTKYEKKRTEELKKQKELEQRLASLKTSIEVFDGLRESLLAIKGVSFEKSGIQFGAQSPEVAINNQFIKESSQAVSSIMQATAISMGKSLEESIGEFSSSDLLEMQIESMRSLYEVQWNQFQKDGVTKEEQDALDETVKKFRELNTQLDNLTERNNIADTLKDLESTIIARGNAKIAMKDGLNIQGTLYKAENQEQAKYYASMKLVIDSTVNKMKELGYSTEEITEYINLETESRKEEIESLKEVTKTEISGAWDALSAISGSFSGVVNAFIEGKQNQTDAQSIFANSSSFIMAIIQIAQSLETFQPAFEVAEEILGRLDEFLSPLRPAIEAISKTTLALMTDLMPFLFPIMKIIASALVIINAVVDTIRKFVKNIFVFVHNILQYLLHPLRASKRDMWDYESIAETWSEAAETLKEIASLTYDIKENTEEKDISAYEEMYQKGLITLSEFNALVSNAYGKNWDRVNTFEGGSYQNGSGGTTIIYSGAITVTIDGTNLSAKEIADELERRTIAGNKTYA